MAAGLVESAAITVAEGLWCLPVGGRLQELPVQAVRGAGKRQPDVARRWPVYARPQRFSWRGTFELTLTKGSTEMANDAGVDWASEKDDVLVCEDGGEELLTRTARPSTGAARSCACSAQGAQAKIDAEVAELKAKLPAHKQVAGARS